MLQKVTSYLGRLLRIPKAASVTATVIPIVSSCNSKLSVPPTAGINSKPSVPPTTDEHKYTLRRNTSTSHSRSVIKQSLKTTLPSSQFSMASLKTTNDNIIWMDLEMTGLDLKKDVIMEIACIITDKDLNEIARTSEIVIHVPDHLLDSMQAWCVATHGSSGLTDACRRSEVAVSEAESQLVQFLQQHTESGVSPLGGNSVTMDRMFLNTFMPKVVEHLHYRNIDVSTIKELVRRWYPKEFENMPDKRWIHKAVADIEDSIAELKYYRSVIFKSPVSEKRSDVQYK